MTSTAASSPTTSTSPVHDYDHRNDHDYDRRKDLSLDTENSLEAAVKAAESPRTVVLRVGGGVRKWQRKRFGRGAELWGEDVKE
eukprot:CAMPEP_0174905838 /NCGR_PEP_ID=MMETSP0167-20121228/54436_1 /TAXON_ID=38298 /ORGANISM="Rhodella maculata, Strain CCMP736" /LENGTH=83 /DNA_ID=CAMNT_0016148909 /DNA_START=120 /DNA_END=368 /DNA_ORIENTATION=+